MSHPAESNPLLAAAIDYARRGWRVVPLHACGADERRTDGELGCSCGNPECKSQGKHPRFNAWQNEASTDERQVRAWWAKWPEANVGCALGPESGIVAIDVDTKAGEDLIKELAGGQVERTVLFKTGKGHRLLYAVPADLPAPPVTRVVQLGGTEAVRFQSTGGQCVMPPSLHPSGNFYEWVEERDPGSRDVALMPDWLVAEMCRPSNPEWSDQGARDAHLEGKDFNRDADWYRDVLEPVGFKPAGQANGVMRFTRPGKNSGISVTVGHYRARDGSPALYVFSGSIPGLEALRCYDKFGAYAKLHHNGDFAKASEALTAKGFGRHKRAKPPTSGPSTPAATVTPAAPDWGDPIPLDGASPDLPAFPLNLFPAGLADLCASSAEAVGCPPDYAATHAVAVAAGAIGARYDLQVKRRFWAPSIVWACVVAPPGSGKSPSVAPILKPLYDEQGARSRTGDTKPAFVSDVTMERLARLMEGDPRGLTMVWDEMAGWLTSFNQYKAKGTGNDRTHYLSIWDGRALKVDRSGPDKPPLYAHRPRLSVVGGIQPEVLDALRDGPTDGLFDRILFSYPPDPGLAVETFAEVDERAERAWGKAIRDLWERPMYRDPEEGERPASVLVSDEGREIWKAWTEELAELAARPDAPDYFRSVGAKISGYAARLALVLHLLHEAYGGADGHGVKAEGMHRGVMLAKYFMAHNDRVRRAAGRDRRLVRARAVHRWILGRGEPRFTRSDAWASLRNNTSFAGPEDLDEPLRLLSLHRCVRWVKGHEGGPGRPGIQGAYEVNPKVLDQGPREARTGI